MIKGVQTIDKRPLITIEDIQNYVLGLEIENKDLQQQLDKYKDVIDKIKEEVLSELQMFKPAKNMAISMEIYYIEEKLEKLLEEVE